MTDDFVKIRFGKHCSKDLMKRAMFCNCLSLVVASAASSLPEPKQGDGTTNAQFLRQQCQERRWWKELRLFFRCFKGLD